MASHLDEAPEEKSPIMSPSSPAVVHAEVDYGSPELPESDRGHVTCEPPSKDASDLHDWEMLSRNPSPSPERPDENKDSSDVAEADPQDKPALWPSPTQEEPPHNEDINADAQATEVARENQAQEESMTIDEIPELVKMMTEIQAALTEPEGSIEGEQPAEGPTEDATAGAGEAPNEDIVQAIVTAIQEEAEHVQGDDMVERTPPDSPHVRSGVSSFSHISSPTSYQFSRDGDASDEEGSSWSSDEDDKSQRSGRRSEADSEEANQDVSALSQEGSLGSFSDSSFKLRMAAAAESSRTTPEPGLPPACKIGADPEVEATENPADIEEVLKVTRCLREVVAELSGDEREGSEHDEGAMEEQRWDKKGASRRADVVGALRSGLDRLAEVSHNALAHMGSSDLLHRFWACLEEWMSGLLNCLPAAQRARARLRMELDRMQARARRMGWSKIALIASLAIMAVVAGVAVVKNAALSRALRRKDQEMNQLIIMVFNLQESLQNAAAGSRVPIVRHASCGMSSFSAYGYPEPVSMLAFEALSGAVQC